MNTIKMKNSVLEGDWKKGSGFMPKGRVSPADGVMRPHNGIDLRGVPQDSAVRSPRDGIVIVRGFNPSAGNWIHIKSDGLIFIFMHLYTMDVGTGETVHQGQRIGGVGTTGRSTGLHLHFEVRENGEPIDPNPYIYF